MYSIEIIKHKDIKLSNLIDIIDIKSKAWEYSYQEHMQWIENNILPDDIHILLLENNKYVAYLNLVDITLMIDNSNHKGYGVGNVCSIEKGKGYGKKLMKFANNIIIEEKRVGLLFCKDSLVDFYSKTDWKLIEKEHLSLLFDNNMINAMFFNFEKEYNMVTYKDKSF